MAEQEAPAETEASEAERRLTEALFGPDGAPKEGNEDAIQEALNGIMDEAQRAAALRIWAKSTEEFDAEEQERYGVNADGTIADGGLTDAGREFATYVVEQINEVQDETAKRIAASRARRRASGDSGRLLVDALGLREPLRAAIRAGALALADRLDDDDDETDDEGEAGHAHDDDGTCRHKVELGGEPFVLIRANKVPGSKIGAITIVVGGGAYYASKGRPGVDGALSVENMLAMATQGVEQFGDRAESATDVDDVQRLLREGFGIDLNGAPVTRSGARPGTQRRGTRFRMPDAATEPGDAAGSDVTASGSGPSTEDPAPPTWPRTTGDTPRTGESEAPPGKAGDDGGTSSPSSPSSGGGDASPSGTDQSGQ